MQKTYTNLYLLKRFLPYYGKYYPTLILDLICAGFSTMCDLVLPIILRYLTNTARQDLSLLTVKLILTLGVIFVLLRVVDTIANQVRYYQELLPTCLMLQSLHITVLKSFL